MPSKKSSSASEDACYLTEESLVQDLALVVQGGKGPFRCRAVTFEFDFASGRTDLIGLDRDDELHAFEAKLTKWRKALEQAGRNTSYAHYTYVVLPSRTAASALKASDEFRRRGVGLVVLGKTVPRIEIMPRRAEPLLPWLTDTAMKRFFPL